MEGGRNWKLIAFNKGVNRARKALHWCPKGEIVCLEHHMSRSLDWFVVNMKNTGNTNRELHRGKNF